MNKEIERKYFLNGLPENFKIQKVMKIKQSFLYKDKNTVIRVREIKANNKTEYIYTVKTSGDIQNTNKMLANKYEIESNISQSLYEELVNKKISNTIDKTRIIMPIENNLKVEIDIYHDYLEDFLTAEVEFPNEDDSKKFVKPLWLGEEIGYKEFSNSKLSFMTREILLSKTPNEVMESNKKIISVLNALI